MKMQGLPAKIVTPSHICGSHCVRMTGRVHKIMIWQALGLGLARSLSEIGYLLLTSWRSAVR